MYGSVGRHYGMNMVDKMILIVLVLCPQGKLSKKIAIHLQKNRKKRNEKLNSMLILFYHLPMHPYHEVYSIYGSFCDWSAVHVSIQVRSFALMICTAEIKEEYRTVKTLESVSDLDNGNRLPYNQHNYEITKETDNRSIQMIMISAIKEK